MVKWYQLHPLSPGSGHKEIKSWMNKATARIEALEAERDTHKHDSQRFRAAASNYATKLKEVEVELDKSINLNLTLEAERDRLREALKATLDHYHEDARDARATLAEHAKEPADEQA